MKQTLLFVLILSGLADLTANVIREYHYVEQLMHWYGAQAYCRNMFTDLATIANQDDNDNLQNLLRNRGQQAWVGLCDDAIRWKWTLGEADFNSEFHSWAAGGPSYAASPLYCTAITPGGDWISEKCSQSLSAVCYNEPGPTKYILVQGHMSWDKALAHCRSTYTSLASARDKSENHEVHSLVSGCSWIGLQKFFWGYWSDQSPKTFTNWNDTEPMIAQVGDKNCVTVNATTGKWLANGYAAKFHFVCETVSQMKKNKNTFKLKFQSEANLNDPAVQPQILEQLQRKLEKHGTLEKLRWIQTNGKTFHKEHDKKEKGSCG